MVSGPTQMVDSLDTWDTLYRLDGLGTIGKTLEAIQGSSEMTLLSHGLAIGIGLGLTVFLKVVVGL